MLRSPREHRERERIRRVGAAAGKTKATAMAMVLAEIEAAFDHTAAICSFKTRVERLIDLGARHPTVRARFTARAGLLADCDLAGAVVLVEQWWREERKAVQIASLFGHGTRLSLETLRELRLILRLMRFKHREAAFPAIVAVLSERPLSIAAE